MHQNKDNTDIRPTVRPIVSVAIEVAVALAVVSAGLLSCATRGAPYAPPRSPVVPEVIEIIDDGVPLADSPAVPVIDASHAGEGFIIASAMSEDRLKLQIVHEGESYNYELPRDGSPIAVPTNMGDGEYLARVMEHTSGDLYAEIASELIDVSLADPSAPFTVPNLYCDYSSDSPCAAKALELAAPAQTQAEAAALICEWVAENISYDQLKAFELADDKGYVPSPDDTFASGGGICFDHASLAAAMCRSAGIPARIATGYVGSSGIYHSWVEVYVDGDWASDHFRIKANEWSVCDVARAAAGEGGTVGDGSRYAVNKVF